MVHYRRHQPATYPTPRLPWDIHAKRRIAIQEEPRTRLIFLNSRNSSTMIWSFDPQQNPWPSPEMPPYHANTAQTVCQGQSSFLFSAMALHLYCETVKPNEPCLKDHKALRYFSTINANKTEEPELCQGGSGWKDFKFFPTHASIYSWSLPFIWCVLVGIPKIQVPSVKLPAMLMHPSGRPTRDTLVGDGCTKPCSF